MPRTTVRIGDPGIDARWVRRRGLGSAAACTWMVVTLALIAVGAPLRFGPIGWIEAWQEANFGRVSPILAALPFIPLTVAPALALLLPAAVDRPFLLGVQQAFHTGTGPRFRPSDDGQRKTLTRALIVAASCLAIGLCTLAGGVVLAVGESNRPAATPVPTTYAAALASDGEGPPLHIVDAAPSDRSWLEVETVRGHTNRTAWRALHPTGGYGPDMVFQSIPMSVQGDGSLRPLGRTGIGRVKPMDGWTAGRLRAAGFAVAPRPLQFESWTATGDSVDAVMPGFMTAMLGFVTTILAGAFAFRFRRLRSALPNATKPHPRWTSTARRPKPYRGTTSRPVGARRRGPSK